MKLNELTDEQIKEYYHLFKANGEKTKRHRDVVEHGHSTKFAYHIVRLMDEVEQILLLGDLDLTRSRELLKTIRRGEKTLDWIEKYFEERERSLEEAYIKSELPFGPPEEDIKELLFKCLEMHYGKLTAQTLSNVELAGKLFEIEEKIQNLRRSVE